jgi:hypothetical protein
MRLTRHLPLLALVIAVSGCKSGTPELAEVPPPSQGPASTRPIIKSADSVTGKVISYNAIGRFVVVNFPVTRVPAVGHTMFAYREGLKVGEIKITGPQQDDNIVADLVNGEVRKGDEVREK